MCLSSGFYFPFLDSLLACGARFVAQRAGCKAVAERQMIRKDVAASERNFVP